MKNNHKNNETYFLAARTNSVINCVETRSSALKLPDVKTLTHFLWEELPTGGAKVMFSICKFKISVRNTAITILLCP